MTEASDASDRDRSARPPPSAIEALFEACLSQPEASWPQAIEAACVAHSDHARELRERFALLQRLAFDRDPTATTLPERLGDFVLGRRLGAGGMGIVHVARQESLGRDVALKLIRPESLFFAGARERFAREVAAVARLAHPGVVPIYASGEASGLPYFAMELVAGCTLAEAIEALRATGHRDGAALQAAIARITALRFATAGAAHDAASEPDGALTGPWIRVMLRLARDVARALEHAHGRGVLHRDVKPSNLLVDARGQVRLIDFGLASASGTSKLTRSGAQLGSLPYMSPEQLRGAAVDARSDVYALGVTLYELLALRLPYFDDDASRTREAILAGAPAPLREQVPGLPWDVETVCLTAMERDPARRYASAADFARDLDHLLALEPIDAQRPATALRVRRWIERHPTRSVALALGFLLVVVGPSVAFFAVKHQRDSFHRAAITAQRTTGFMTRLFTSSDPYANNDPDLPVRAVLDRARAELDEELATEPEVQARLSHSLGDAYLQLGVTAPATELLAQSLALQQEHFAPDSFSIAATLLSLGRAALMDGDFTIARAWLEEAAAIAGELDDPAPAHEWALERDAVWFVRLEAALGDVTYANGDAAGAEQRYRKALALAQRTGADSDWPARVWVSLSTALIDLGRVDEARAGLELALQLARRVQPQGSLVEIELLSNRGHLLLQEGRFDEVAATLTDAVARCRPLVGAGHSTFVTLLGNLGSVEARRGQPAAAIAPLTEALDHFKLTTSPDDPTLIGWSYQLVTALRDAQGDAAAEASAKELLPALERAGPEYAKWLAECRRLTTLTPTPPRDD